MISFPREIGVLSINLETEKCRGLLSGTTCGGPEGAFPGRSAPILTLCSLRATHNRCSARLQLAVLFMSGTIMHDDMFPLAPRRFPALQPEWSRYKEGGSAQFRCMRISTVGSYQVSGRYPGARHRRGVDAVVGRVEGRAVEY